MSDKDEHQAINPDDAIPARVLDGRQNPFIWFHKSILQRYHLSSIELRVYLILAFHADDHGKCFPGLVTIINESGVARQSVISAIETLEEKELITVLRRTTKTKSGKTRRLVNIYTLLEPKLKYDPNLKNWWSTD